MPARRKRAPTREWEIFEANTLQGNFVGLFFLSLAEVFQVLRQNSLIMAITKAGKQLYKFETQFILNIFDKNDVI